MRDIAELKDLTKKEKLMVIEALWEDLSQEDGDIESPDWHEVSLSETRKHLQSGTEKILNWVFAKKELRKRFK